MRVLIVGVFPRGPIRGGVEASTAQLAVALAKHADLEVHVAAFNSSVTQPRREVRDGLTVHWMPRWRRGSTLQMLSLGAAQVARLERKIGPDLLHGQGPTPLGLSARFSSRPMVLTVHGLEMLSRRTQGVHTFAGPLGKFRRHTASLVMQLSVQRANGVILISPYVQRFLGPLIGGKLSVAIDNPVACEFFEVPSAPDSGTLLCVANLSELKNQALLVRALAGVVPRHPRVRLLLAGPTTDAKYAAQIRALAETLRLSERVHVLGEASPERVQELYAAADLVLLGSVQETAPLAIAQAMAAGRPVVATAVGGVPFMVHEGVTGALVPSDDEAAMAAAIDVLLSHADRARAMGAAARAEACNRFLPDTIATRTLEFYRQVAGCAC